MNHRPQLNWLLWVMGITVPLLMGLGCIQLLIGRSFLRYEYYRDGFPEEPFGMTADERYELASVAIDFLDSWEQPSEAITMLEQQIHNGEPLYGQRELDHMVDTKVRTDIIRWIVILSTAVLSIGTVIIVDKTGSWHLVWIALNRGGGITVALLLAISSYILVAWRSFFTRFHQLLFPAGTWTFGYSQGLIRLFPERFWFDIGVIIGVGTLIGGIMLTVVTHWLSKRTASL